MPIHPEEQRIIPFNDNWYYCCRSRADLSSVIRSVDNNDSFWTFVQLPHAIDEESPTRVKKRHHWYHKRFQWDKPVNASSERIQLVLESVSSTNSDQPQTLMDNITIWFNSVEIFAQSSPIESITVDLTEHLTYSNEYEQFNEDNILFIRSRHHLLSANLHLAVTETAADLINSDPIENSTMLRPGSFSGRKNRVLDYLVVFNQNDGRFNIESSLRVKSRDKSPSPTPPDIVVDDIDGYGPERSRRSTNLGGDIQVPRLNIVMLIVGTRGDVQPFIAFGKTLRKAGHRVRLATHERFRSAVRKHGIEFYPIASNPDDLMSFMVKNGGVFPSFSSILEGDLKKKRQDVAAILQSTWKACIEPDDETGAPFLAEAIIANPPSFGHIHCAQRLQIPLHIMFTMPWSPTTAFPHAFCKVDYSKTPRAKLNLLSYSLIEGFTWSGTADVINDFRRDVLELPPFHNRQGIRMLVDEHVPHTYCWSPSLVPRPNDWPSHIDISGYFFLDTDPNEYQPPDDLAEFLGLNKDQSVDPPMYIGFGSITGNDPHHLLEAVLGALEMTGYRALLSGFDDEDIDLPTSVFKIKDIPHDWLFQHVSAVCHHGGAGTTAAGLRAGRPTIIVPFFGDQFFWASVVEKAGAGPTPVSGKNVTAEALAEAFRLAHQPEIKEAAARVQKTLEKEDGCATALRIFHSHLPLSAMRSDLESTFAACYRVDEYDIQISRPVAQVLVATGAIDESQLRLHPTRKWKSIYDHRIHLPASGALKHTQKAISYIFLQPPGDIRRSLSSGNIVTGVVHGVGEVCKDVGKGIAHLSVGALSLYGELTDVLDRVPALYDPYSELDRHERPYVIDLRTGARAAGHSLMYGWKDGITGLTRKPRVGYRRHGIIGGATGVLVGTANGFIKPTAGSLASVTWLGRGAYASIKKKRRRKHSYKHEEQHVVLNKLSNRPSFPSYDDHHSDDYEDMEYCDDQNKQAPNAIKFASVVSGYPPEVCQHILDEFEKVKEHRQSIASSLPNPTDHRRSRFRLPHRSCLGKNRRYSDSAL